MIHPKVRQKIDTTGKVPRVEISFSFRVPAQFDTLNLSDEIRDAMADAFTRVVVAKLRTLHRQQGHAP